METVLESEKIDASNGEPDLDHLSEWDADKALCGANVSKRKTTPVTAERYPNQCIVCIELGDALVRAGTHRY